jgi:hypothetical protein
MVPPMNRNRITETFRWSVLAAMSVLNVTAAVTVDKTEYKGWRNCYRVTNGEVDLVVTADVGPRVIRFGFVGGQNLFKEYAEQLGKSGEKEFQARGGHRVWKAPEDPVASWAPDNAPVEVRVTAGGLVAREPVEPLTGLQKEIEVSMAPSGSEVTVTHRIANRTLMKIEFTTWALTQMAPGGVGFTGFPPRGTHPKNLEPANPLVMWTYTDLSDPRWTFTKKYLVLRQDPNNAVPQKLGHFNPHTWAAYLLHGELFVKQYEADALRSYPDFGCSFETFTNNEFLELETLGPMAQAPPGHTAAHVERWSLHRPVVVPAFTDAEIDRAVAPFVR